MPNLKQRRYTNERNLQARCKRLVPYNSLLFLYTSKYIERDNQSHSHTVYLCKYLDLHGLATKYHLGGTYYVICMDLSLWVLTKKKGLIKKRENDFLLLCCGSNFLAMFHISLAISLRHPNSRSISEMKIVEPILLSLVNLMDKTLTVFLTKHFIAGNKFHT
mgnify:CR=1 FL=1